MNSIARSRQWLAPGSVLSAGAVFGDLSLGSSGASSGPIRSVAPGNRGSSVDERTTIGRLRAVLRRKHERANPRGARFEQDRIAGPRPIECGLQVVTGANSDGGAGDRRAPAHK